MKKKVIIVVVILLVGLLAINVYIFKLMSKENKKNISLESNVLKPVTQEELIQGWYFGETKRSGTPDTWVLLLKGTRGAKWADPTN